MGCAVAVAANLPAGSPIVTHVGLARKAPALLAIDGCVTGCLKRALDKMGVPVDVHLVVERHGFPRQRAGKESDELFHQVVEEAVLALGQLPDG